MESEEGREITPLASNPRLRIVGNIKMMGSVMTQNYGNEKALERYRNPLVLPFSLILHYNKVSHDYGE